LTPVGPPTGTKPGSTALASLIVCSEARNSDFNRLGPKAGYSEIIIDPFSGSGTTIIACQRTRRIARTMELDPAYVDLAVRRWEATSGKVALHAESGLSLDELAGTRGVPSPHYAFERR
jgi:hypothetical protein